MVRDEKYPNLGALVGIAGIRTYEGFAIRVTKEEKVR